MKISSALILSSLLLLAACTNADKNKVGIIINQDVLKAYDNLDASLSQERSKIFFDNGGEATTCTSYYTFISKSSIQESTYNQMVKSEYLICDALKILSGVNFSNNPYQGGLGLGEKLSGNLDLRSFSSSLFRVSNEDNHTLKSLYPKDVKYTDSTATVDNEDWVFGMEVVGVVDVNRNNIPDWIVWVSDESKSGTYRSYFSLIVYDPDSKNNFVATQAN